MVKVGPDMETFDGRKSGFGYSSNGVILGFSHLHLSGAQGKYGNILVAPVTGPLNLNDIKTPRTDEVNHVGYYAAKLTRYNVKAELTSSRRVGFHRYTFPASEQSHITIDVAHALSLGTGLASTEVSRRRDPSHEQIAKRRVWRASPEAGTAAASTRSTTTMVLDTPAPRPRRPGREAL
jgi:putative alpha-1,2-mannosidase